MPEATTHCDDVDDLVVLATRCVDKKELDANELRTSSGNNVLLQYFSVLT